MKGILLYLLCAISYLTTTAQHRNVCGVTYFDSVPLYIESSLYADRLYPGKEFMTVPKEVSVSLLQRETGVCGNTLFRLVKSCIDRSKLDLVEYKILFSDNRFFDWQTLPKVSLLIRTSLQRDEKMTIQFRWKESHRLIQEVFINRPDWAPLVNGFRERNATDTFDNKLKSNAAYKTRQLLPGFVIMKDSTITLQPGRQIELQFDSRNINIDSCIEYRIRDANSKEAEPWHFTGHVLSLRNINSKHQYILDVRYSGEKTIKTYHINALSFWWQKTFAIIIFILAGLCFLTLTPVLFVKWRHKKIKVEEDRLKEQLKTVQSKLNPHFVFNGMSSISGLVSSEQNERANEYLNTFSDIMRSTLKNSDHLFIPLSDEIDNLKRYIELEKLGLAFRFELYIDPDLDLSVIDFPPMLLQPTIENAVKHGVADLGQNGVILLSLVKRDNDLLVTIRDNGNAGVLKPSKVTGGNGIRLTKERVEILAKLFPKDKIIYRLEHTETGTLASFRFENWLA